MMKPIEKVTLSIGQWNEMQLKMQNMEEALSFYANESNYASKNGMWFTNIMSDGGGVARAALGIQND